MTTTKLPPLLQQSCDFLTQEVTKYAETGIWFEKHWRTSGDPRVFSPFWQRKYMRECAKQLKRPFVVVEINTYEGFRANICFKKSKRTQVLASALMLGATEVKSRWYTKDFKNVGIFQLTRRKTMFDFDVHDPTLFNNWLDLCKNDPDYRKALSLPS
jgi:hypothetical protein